MMRYTGISDFQSWAEALNVGKRNDFQYATAGGSIASFAGIPIVTSPYVPKLERFEVDYSRPLIVRLVHGRTVDIRTWEEDQIFLMPGGGPNLIMTPEVYGVIRGLLP